MFVLGRCQQKLVELRLNVLFIDLFLLGFDDCLEDVVQVMRRSGAHQVNLVSGLVNCK